MSGRLEASRDPQCVKTFGVLERLWSAKSHAVCDKIVRSDQSAGNRSEGFSGKLLQFVVLFGTMTKVWGNAQCLTAYKWFADSLTTLYCLCDAGLLALDIVRASNAILARSLPETRHRIKRRRERRANCANEGTVATWKQ